MLSYLRQNGRPGEDSVHRGDCRMASRHTRPHSRKGCASCSLMHGPSAQWARADLCSPRASLSDHA
ncbi:hypothetical protein [Streptomyces sp. NPDC058855]|uniref:hypothetical protein n=1 Tax=Streptomyces sp. NPDC058855 TaxID=3346651 RepID=UPI003689C000